MCGLASRRGDCSDLQQVERQHGEFLVVQVVGSDLTAFAVEELSFFDYRGYVFCYDFVTF
jgi:hypothetical protein